MSCSCCLDVADHIDVCPAVQTEVFDYIALCWSRDVRSRSRRRCRTRSIISNIIRNLNNSLFQIPDRIQRQGWRWSSYRSVVYAYVAHWTLHLMVNVAPSADAGSRSRVRNWRWIVRFTSFTHSRGSSCRCIPRFHRFTRSHPSRPFTTLTRHYPPQTASRLLAITISARAPVGHYHLLPQLLAHSHVLRRPRLLLVVVCFFVGLVRVPIAIAVAEDAQHVQREEDFANVHDFLSIQTIY